MKKLLKCMYLFFVSILIVSILPAMKVYAATGEIEPNDNQDSATAIKINTAYSGNIKDGYDADYYKVVVPVDGVVTVNFNHGEIPGDSNEYWKISFLDSKNNEYMGYYVKGNVAQSSFERGLYKGTYYLKVESRNEWQYCDNNYSISVIPKSNNLYEKEFNDSMSSANTIKANKSYSGDINNAYDTDYYKVIIPSDGEVTVNFNHKEIPGDSTEYWKVSFLDSKNNEYIGYYVQGNDAQAYIKRGLPKGTYYLKVEPRYEWKYCDDKYNISVALKNNKYYEKEFNNSMDSANMIDLNTKYTGNIYNGDDTDYYKVVVPSDGAVAVNFTHDKVEGDNDNRWSVALLNSYNEEFCNYYIQGNEDKTKETINLKKGTYYLRVKPYNYYEYNNMDYKIWVNAEIKVTDVKLNKTSLSLEKGKSTTLTATVSPSNAINKAVTWSSSNTKVAKVDSNGKITAVGEGTADIICEAKDGSKKKSTCKVTVINSVSVTSIKLNKTNLSLKQGKTAILIATVNPSNAYNKAVIWRTENEKIAKVDSNGKVTAIGNGTTKIFCMTKDGNFQIVTCKVTVTK